MHANSSAVGEHVQNEWPEHMHATLETFQAMRFYEHGAQVFLIHLTAAINNSHLHKANTQLARERRCLIPPLEAEP